jgi:branched-chain amino acid transport system permease protein
MGLVMSLCERVTVLDSGTVIAEGEPAEVASHPAVLEAYLGRTELPDLPARPASQPAPPQSLPTAGRHD